LEFAAVADDNGGFATQRDCLCEIGKSQTLVG